MCIERVCRIHMIQARYSHPAAGLASGATGGEVAASGTGGRGCVAASRLRLARSCCIVEPGLGVDAGSYTRDQLAGYFQNSRTRQVIDSSRTAAGT
jgi:hypothetical protein